VLQGPPAAAGPELEDSARLFGLALPADAATPPPMVACEVWAEHWPAVRLFLAMQTQLRISFGGVEGFDYAVLPVVERRLGMRPRQARLAFDDLRVMERTLIKWHNKE